jgi:ABC-2 type transport system ATP-binding protein
MMAAHALEMSGISSGYSGKQILHNIRLKITEPSIYVVLGPNGAGKTTLFRTICGILEAKGGAVQFDGEDVYDSSETRKRMIYMSHLNALPEEMTVLQALNFFCEIEGGGDINHVVEALRLEPLLNKKISDLSQGQKKRVSIAKVFLRDRDLYLLDEPTSNVDPKVSKEIREYLLNLSRDKIVLYSSHNLYEAREIGTYIILIKDGTIKFFDKISNLQRGKRRYGIRSPDDLTKMIGAEFSNGYYIVSLDAPEEAGALVRDLVYRGAVITEMRELDNPLEELFQ